MNLKKLEQQFQDLEQRNKKMRQYYDPRSKSPHKHPYMQDIRADYKYDSVLFGLDMFWLKSPVPNEVSQRDTPYIVIPQSPTPKKNPVRRVIARLKDTELLYDDNSKGKELRQGAFGEIKIKKLKQKKTYIMKSQKPDWKTTSTAKASLVNKSAEIQMPYNEQETSIMISKEEKINKQIVRPRTKNEILQDLHIFNNEIPLKPILPSYQSTNSSISSYKYQIKIRIDEQHIHESPFKILICDLTLPDKPKFPLTSNEANKDGFLVFDNNSILYDTSNIPWQSTNLKDHLLQITVYNKFSTEILQTHVQFIEQTSKHTSVAISPDLPTPHQNPKSIQLPRFRNYTVHPMSQALYKYKTRSQAFSPTQYYAHYNMLAKNEYIDKKYPPSPKKRTNYKLRPTTEIGIQGLKYSRRF